MTKRRPFRCFKASPEVIHLTVMLYIRFPLSLRNVEDLLHEHGIEVTHETVRFWWMGGVKGTRQKRERGAAELANQASTALLRDP